MSTVDEMTFEDAFAALSGIVEELDAGELTLERTIALFEQGQTLARRCQHLLDAAELRVTRAGEEELEP